MYSIYYVYISVDHQHLLSLPTRRSSDLNFARSLSVETAFTVLAIARSLKAAGKDVIELEIGDSPFDSTAAARAGGMDADRKSTRLNSSHLVISYAVFCLQKKIIHKVDIK